MASVPVPSAAASRTQVGQDGVIMTRTPLRVSFAGGGTDLAAFYETEPGAVFFTVLRTSDEWGGVPVFRPGLVLGETHSPTFRLLVDGVPGLAFSHEGKPMGYVDVDLPSMMRSRNTGVGLDTADMVLHMTPIAKVAAATAQAASLPVARGD